MPSGLARCSSRLFQDRHEALARPYGAAAKPQRQPFPPLEIILQ